MRHAMTAIDTAAVAATMPCTIGPSKMSIIGVVIISNPSKKDAKSMLMTLSVG
jgi:hypothetical protein